MYEMIPKKKNSPKHVINKKQQDKTSKQRSIFSATAWSDINVPKGFLSLPQNNVVQRKLPGAPQDAKELIETQKELQSKSKDDITEAVKKDNPDDEGAYTTVGFEHEFAQFKDGQYNPLSGQEHVELAKTEILLSYAGLPFILETDSLDTIELVGAPLIIPTPKEYPVPFADDIKMADELIQSALKNICQAGTFNELITRFVNDMGLAFEKKYPAEINSQKIDNLKEIIDNLEIKFGTKGSGIQPQVNFATSALVYDTAKDISPSKSVGSRTEIYLKEEKKYRDEIMKITGTNIPPNITIFFKQLAKTLSFAKFEEFLIKYKKMENGEISKYPAKSQKSQESQEPQSFQELGIYISLVKDTNTFWLKDTIFNFGMGILVPHDWDIVHQVCLKMKKKSAFENCKKQIDILLQKICELTKNEYKCPHEKPDVKYLEHTPEFLGARQDTYVSLDGKAKATAFKDTSMHLVEVRGLTSELIHGDMFNRVEARLLEKSPLQFTNTPFGYNVEINYIEKDHVVIINSLPSDQCLGRKSSTCSISESKCSEIEYDDWKDDHCKMITVQEGPSSYYCIILNEEQTSQFQYFIRRVLVVSSYRQARIASS